MIDSGIEENIRCSSGFINAIIGFGVLSAFPANIYRFIQKHINNVYVNYLPVLIVANLIVKMVTCFNKIGQDVPVLFKRQPAYAFTLVKNSCWGRDKSARMCLNALLIRPACENDLDNLVRIDLECQPEGSGGWSKEVFKYTLSQSHACVLVACLNKEKGEGHAGSSSALDNYSPGGPLQCANPLTEISAMIGFISGSYVADELQIENLAVDIDFRGRSVGQTLLRHLLHENGFLKDGSTVTPCKSPVKCILEVKEGNVSALGLYKKFGFSVNGKRKNFYPDGSAALLMELLSC
jgi:ribosomal protein S18 acetylase RimI-like enzyme